VKRNQIADEVRTAYSNLTTAFRQRQAALALLQASPASYNAALEPYHAGLRNLLGVTAAQRTSAGARLTDVLARTQVLIWLANLAFTTGGSIRLNTARPRPMTSIRRSAFGILLLSSLVMTGCGRAPSFDIVGSFFPAWLVCVVVAILLTVVLGALLNRYVEIVWPVLFYSGLTAIFAFVLWLALFR
jgi:hypothetical protein